MVQVTQTARGRSDAALRLQTAKSGQAVNEHNVRQALRQCLPLMLGTLELDNLGPNSKKRTRDKSASRQPYCDRNGPFPVFIAYIAYLRSIACMLVVVGPIQARIRPLHRHHLSQCRFTVEFS